MENLDREAVQARLPDVRFPMSLPKHPLKRWLKLAVGRALSLLMPARFAALRAGNVNGEYSTADRWMLSVLAHRASRSGKPDTLHAAHQKFWTTQAAADLMLNLGDQRLHELLELRTPVIIAPFREALRETGCTSLIEIGCGSGMVLEWFADKYPELTELHGIDLNAGLIDACKTRSNPRLRFHLGDAIALVRSLAQTPQALLSYGGVLEYFLDTQLADLFAWLRTQHAPAVVALVEPVGVNHDLERQLESQLYGVEHSFSHNYPRLLREAGYELRFQDEIMAGDTRFLMVVAVASGA